MERNNNKSCFTDYILKNINHFQKDEADFWHRKVFLKVGFLQFSKDQKELEEVFIKNLFDYMLSMGKCLLTVNWSEMGIKTVDTLVLLAIASLSCGDYYLLLATIYLLLRVYIMCTLWVFSILIPEKNQRKCVIAMNSWAGWNRSRKNTFAI